MANNTQKSNKQKDATLYSIPEAIERMKKYSKEGFDASAELHVKLNTDIKKQDQAIRFSLTLPHGTGKSKTVAVFSSGKVPGADLELKEEDIERIEKGDLKPKIDFDIIVAEPRFMPKLAKVAKILGPLGMMPNPKTGTVSDKPSEAIEEIKKGKIIIKTEKDASVIHTIFGKVSFEKDHLEENLMEILKTLKQNKPSKLKLDLLKNAYICSSMGPSIKLDLSTL